MSTEVVDPVLPISLLVSRWEKHRDEMRTEAGAARWWQWRRRWALNGAAAAYQMEINAALEIGGTCQPILREALERRRASK